MFSSHDMTHPNPSAVDELLASLRTVFHSSYSYGINIIKREVPHFTNAKIHDCPFFDRHLTIRVRERRSVENAQVGSTLLPKSPIA